MIQLLPKAVGRLKPKGAKGAMTTVTPEGLGFLLALPCPFSSYWQALHKQQLGVTGPFQRWLGLKS